MTRRWLSVFVGSLLWLKVKLFMLAPFQLSSMPMLPSVASHIAFRKVLRRMMFMVPLNTNTMSIPRRTVWSPSFSYVFRFCHQLVDCIHYYWFSSNCVLHFRDALQFSVLVGVRQVQVARLLSKAFIADCFGACKYIPGPLGRGIISSVSWELILKILLLGSVVAELTCVLLWGSNELGSFFSFLLSAMFIFY